MNVISLGGCAPQPLAHYLKALGILRLVAEQKDPAARGWWRDERFWIAGSLSEQEFVAFFDSEYCPSPLFNPWGARSGFYSGDSERKAREALECIAAAEGVRFGFFRAAAAEAAKVVPPTKPESDDAEAMLLRDLRKRLRGPFTYWLDSAAAVVGQSIVKPSLFGTGGNEGSGSYTSAYMQALVECLISRNRAESLVWALFGGVPRPASLWDQSPGQFAPGAITNPARAATNPWDLVLAFEGALVVRSSIATRSSGTNDRWLSSPFFVAPRSAGYGTAAEIDEHVVNKGKKMPGRGEQWFPLWGQPTTFAEVGRLFSEGKAAVGRGRARDAWSMARAVASLGTSRGIHEFVRYGYQQRNNLATHFAIPLGRFRVRETSEPLLGLLDDLDAWLSRVRREARGKNTPARLQQAERRLADALFAVVQHAHEPGRWQGVLTAMVDVEGTLASGSGFAAGPIPQLQPGWVTASDDGSAELRLATALGLATADMGPARHPRWGPIRRHAIPLSRDGTRFDTVSEGAKARLVRRTENVMLGRDPIADCLALVMRRLTEASQGGLRHLPLAPAPKAGAHVDDLALLTSGGVDLARTLHLARAFMALDSSRWALHPAPPAHTPRRQAWPDDGWTAVRLALLPWPLEEQRDVGADPGIIRRLASGDAAGAVALARRRLEAKGVVVPFTAATTDPATGRVWAAALAFPITRQTAKRLCRRLAPSAQKEAAYA